MRTQSMSLMCLWSESATISIQSCAAQYRRHQNDCSKCTHCEVGALHAGEKPRKAQRKKHCQRCGSTGLRVIGGYRCICCYNREREFLLGKNRKGSAPIHAHPVYELDVLVVGGTRIVHIDRVTSAAEALLVAMQRTGKEVARPYVRLTMQTAAVVRSIQMRMFA